MDVSSALPSQTPTLHEEVPSSQVDIQQAERAFHRLEREASRASEGALQALSTEKDNNTEKRDLEKAELSNDEEPFDLKEYLSASNDAHIQAGVKHKHVGVTWEDLQVDVIGGANHKVSERSLAMQFELF